jgi:hypothetical protein
VVLKAGHVIRGIYSFDLSLLEKGTNLLPPVLTIACFPIVTCLVRVSLVFVVALFKPPFIFSGRVTYGLGLAI